MKNWIREQHAQSLSKFNLKFKLLWSVVEPIKQPGETKVKCFIKFKIL